MTDDPQRTCPDCGRIRLDGIVRERDALRAENETLRGLLRDILPWLGPSEHDERLYDGPFNARSSNLGKLYARAHNALADKESP